MKPLNLVFTALVCALLLAACAPKEAPRVVLPDTGADASEVSAEASGETGGDPAFEAEALRTAETPDILRLLLVDGAETGQLILAGGNGAHDIYTLEVGDIPVCLDGEPADASALEDGMTVEVACFGMLVSLPAQLGSVRSINAYSRGTAQNPGGTLYDLCGLYLQVLNDLWDKDDGLNGGASYVSVDLSAAPWPEYLPESAKYAVAWVFASQHDAAPLTLSYDELRERGYLTDVTPDGSNWTAYWWDDGLLFRITADEWAEDEAYSLPVVKFSAEKWRSPIGAYYFSHCKAVWAEMGAWAGYSVGAEMIS